MFYICEAYCSYYNQTSLTLRLTPIFIPDVKYLQNTDIVDLLELPAHEFHETLNCSREPHNRLTGGGEKPSCYWQNLSTGTGICVTG